MRRTSWALALALTGAACTSTTTGSPDGGAPPDAGGEKDGGDGGGGQPPPPDGGPCADGERVPCGSKVGACEPGVRVCKDGAFGACEGEIVPTDERCNGADDDCDGRVDEDLGAVTCGTGPCRVEVEACREGAPVACTPRAAPSAEDACGDGVDDDCDGEVDETCECRGADERACLPDGSPPPPETIGRCRVGRQRCVDFRWGPCEGAVQPGNEVCNAVDDDCDGATDEELGERTCGEGACARTVATCEEGRVVTCLPGAPSAERCNEGAPIDDDCDGETDEGLAPVTCGAGACARTVAACTACIAGVPAAETCNGADDDCDGAADEGLGVVACGEGACRRQVPACVRGEPGVCEPGAPRAEACNGVDDDCDGAADEGAEADASCDDGDACTGPHACRDTRCVALAPPPRCDDGDPCTDDRCDGAGGCTHTPAAGGGACDDGDFCTIGDACRDGRCEGAARPCGEDGPCDVAVCDTQAQACARAPRDDGTRCDDGRGCTADDFCTDGACGGMPVECPGSADGCRRGTCDEPSGACALVDAADGLACDDGNLCTAADRCDGGACAGGSARTCTAADACGTAACDPTTGQCVATPGPDGEACDDGRACTGGDTCTGGTCGGPRRTCAAPADPCRIALCDEAAGGCVERAAPDGGGCDDGDPCTERDRCVAGACRGAALDCSGAAAGPCTAGVCDPSAGGCVAAPVGNGTACDDGLFCTGGETCTDGACGGGAPIDCATFEGSCRAGVCNEETRSCDGAPKEDGTACDDGLFCTAGDACRAGACEAGAARDCSDAAAGACTDGACDEARDACVARPAREGETCDDARACTAGERCADGLCGGGALVECGGLDGACAAGACDDAAGGCVARPVREGRPCAPPDACTEGTACSAGTCAGGQPVSCDAFAGPCRSARCDAADGCVAEPLADGTACEDGDRCTAGDACHGGTCVAGAPPACDAPEGGCVSARCDPDTGACVSEPLPDGAGCDDGDRCTLGDRCASGACVAGAPVACEDAGPCADGVCDPESGACATVPRGDGAPCEDGDRCTLGDRCASGACAPGAPPDCGGPAPACTAHACDPTTGGCVLVAAAPGAACDDGDACTAGERCTDGACTGGAARDCSDFAGPCAAAACDPESGACAAEPFDAETPCEDGDPCTVGETCDADGACEGGRPADCTPLDGPCARGRCDAAHGGCWAEPVGSGEACGEPVCAGGVVTTSRCDTAGACVPADTACGPYACDAGGVRCADACLPGAGGGCAPGATCVDGACEPTGEAGAPCDADGDCTDGFCADGVCCDRRCDGSCERCDRAGAPGVCGDEPALCAGGCSVCVDGACVGDDAACAGSCDRCDGAGRLFECVPAAGDCSGTCADCVATGAGRWDCGAHDDLCRGTCTPCTAKSETRFVCEAPAGAPRLGDACDGPDSDACANGRYTCTADGLGVECLSETVADLRERCNGADDDCDGATDEDFAAKGDGCDGADPDVCATGTWTCTADGAALECANEVGGSQPERCDNADNDCDGASDEDFPGKGEACDGPDADLCASGVRACRADGTGLECRGDVDRPELCNGGDDDCDGAADEDFPQVGQACDGADADLCANGEWTCRADGEAVACTEPGGGLHETCNGLDDDCDGATDEDFPLKGAPCDGPDSDRCANGRFTCAADGNGLTCGDETLTNLRELCNGRDDDCNGAIDDGFPGKGQPCDGPDADGCATGTFTCTADGLDLECVNETGAPARELCNGLDEDCDGETDEDFPQKGAACDGQDSDQCANGVWGCTPDGQTIVCAGEPPGGVTERCNSADDDCDGATDEDFPLKGGACDGADADLCANGIYGCRADGTGVECGGDQGGASETCNGRDDDCDGATDENFTLLGTECDGADGDLCRTGTYTCRADGLGLACINETGSFVELCNGADDDCDGSTDEDFPLKGGACDGPDADACATGTWTCTPDGSDVQCGNEAAGGVPERCDGADNDCDGAVDEDFASLGAPCDGVDADGCANGRFTCKLDGSAVECVNETATNVAETCNGRDDDCDGAIDEDFPLRGAACDGADTDLCARGTFSCKVDGSALECVNETITGLRETCNARDDDCDGATDEDFAGVGLACDGADSDRCANGVATCTADGAGAECVNESVTGVAERCNGADDDCDGATDEDFPEVGAECDGPDADSCANGTFACSAGGLGVACANEAPGGGAAERCNGADDDCDGSTDEGWPDLGTACDGNDVDLCERGTWTCNAGGDDLVCANEAFTTAERCNGADDDCDGATDEGFAELGAACDGPDADLCAGGRFACRADGAGVECAGDAVNNAERCNGLDDDCDGAVDEGFPARGQACDGPDADLCAAGTTACRADGSGVECAGDLERLESCNNLDDDCDGAVDDGFAGKGQPCDGGDADLCARGTGVCSADGSAVECAGDVVRVETCNDLDDDCDGATDETFAGKGQPCDTADADLCANGALACNAAGDGLECGAEEAEDLRERCNGLDDDCDGETDEDFPLEGAPCDGGDADLCANGAWACGADGELECASETVTDIAEQCNGADDDCDGDTDEAFPLKGAGCDGSDPDACATGTWTCTAAGAGVECVNEVGGSIAERCDGADNDCDGAVDEDFPTKGVPCDGADADACASGALGCTADGTGVTCLGDLNRPERCNGADDDCDGATDEDFGTLGQLCDGADTDLCRNGTFTCAADGSGVTCTNETVVNVAERCNGADDDCDGATDEGFGVGLTCDGGDSDLCRNGTSTCKADGSGAECTNESVTGIAERCNGADDDCDGTADEDFPTKGTACDGAGDADLCADGTVACNGDGSGVTCSDGGPSVAERCNGADDDCDGATDEDFPTKGTACDGPDSDLCALGTVVCTADGLGVTCGGESATNLAELCNGADDDCDGATDEAFPTKGAACDGGDDDLCANGTFTCRGDGQAVECTNETATNIVERCDGADNDCDGATDEAFPTKGQPCDGADADLCVHGTFTCRANGSGVECANESPAGIAERCNGADDDCDGATDEGFAGLGDTCDGPDSDACRNGRVVCTGDGAGTVCGDETVTDILERCNGADDDCDGATDETFQTLGTACDGVDSDQCARGTYTCRGDALGVECTNESVTGITETCNGLDDDCDGALDEAWPVGLACDGGDSDLCANGTYTCRANGLDVECQNEAVVNVIDACNGLDDDCDGVTDGPFPTKGTPCDGADADACAHGTFTCRGDGGGLECTNESTTNIPEACNGADDDCDGATDETFANKGAPCDGAADADLCTDGAFACKADGTGTECTDTPPDRVESCNDADDDCDGATDEAVTRSCYSGPGGTAGVGACRTGLQACSAGEFGACGGEIVPTAEFCNNIDDDCDGLTDEGVTRSCYGGPGGTAGAGECRAGTQTCTAGSFGTCAGEVVPAAESCNNLDDDCDGATDDGVTRSCYGGPGGTSGVGVCRSGTQICSAGAFGACAGEIVPSAETCNNGDDDCDGSTDESVTRACYTGPGGTNGVGACHGGTQTCTAGSFGACAGEVVPVAETCNNGDDDCDGSTDESVTRACYSGPGGTSGVGACHDGTQTCSGGAFGTCAGQVTPAGETCNNTDDDCDGSTDESVTRACYSGPGGTSGVGVCRDGTQACAAGVFGVCGGQVTPSAETCNNSDDDCDGSTDESVTRACYSGPGGTQGVGACRAGTEACSGGSFGLCTGQVVPTGELCNNSDDDCDGTTDESITRACYTGPGGTNGVGACRGGTETCSAGAYGACAGQVVPAAETCNNSDDDCDGSTDESVTRACYTGPGGTSGVGACHDGTQACSAGAFGACTGQVTPAAEECNNSDDDCDGTTDESITRACYSGAPATNGVGVCHGGTQACASGVFGTCVGEVIPSAEACNNFDDDCDASTDENVTRSCYTGAAGTAGVGPCHAGTETCSAGAYGACNGQVVPAAEICNNADDDCDAVTDDGVTRSCYTGPVGTAGVGACHAGSETCSAGAFGACAGEVVPAAESCNNGDDDCDGSTDEALVQACYTGPGGTSGVGVCHDGTRTCSAGAYGACTGQVVPSAESCNGADDDCDASTDETFPTKGAACDTLADADLCTDGTFVCTPDGTGVTCDDALPDRVETCNNVDDDCDGSTDEALARACYTGLPGTSGTGVCHDGVETCSGGSYSECLGEVTPSSEICNNSDDDCDGATDDGVVRTCYGGPGGTQGVGICKSGLQTCSAGAYGVCAGEVTPAAETCNGDDDDCDASTDESTCGGNCSVCDPIADACQPNASVCTGNCDTCSGSGTTYDCAASPSLCTGTCDVCTGGGTSFNCAAQPSLCTGLCAVCSGGGTSWSCGASLIACSGCSVCTGGPTNFDCAPDHSECTGPSYPGGTCWSCQVSGTVGTCTSVDADSDGAGDACDNCPAIPNPAGVSGTQPDRDPLEDPRGNPCQPDNTLYVYNVDAPVGVVTLDVNFTQYRIAEDQVQFDLVYDKTRLKLRSQAVSPPGVMLGLEADAALKNLSVTSPIAGRLRVVVSGAAGTAIEDGAGVSSDVELVKVSFDVNVPGPTSISITNYAGVDTIADDVGATLVPEFKP